jgi:hypothetical protein
MDIPALGYPISSEAVTSWFRTTYSREPSTAEVGRIIEAMTARDSTRPLNDAPDGSDPGFTMPERPIA